MSFLRNRESRNADLEPNFEAQGAEHGIFDGAAGRAAARAQVGMASSRGGDASAHVYEYLQTHPNIALSPDDMIGGIHTEVARDNFDQLWHAEQRAIQRKVDLDHSVWTMASPAPSHWDSQNRDLDTKELRQTVRAGGKGIYTPFQCEILASLLGNIGNQNRETVIARLEAASLPLDLLNLLV